MVLSINPLSVSLKIRIRADWLAFFLLVLELERLQEWQNSSGSLSSQEELSLLSEVRYFILCVRPVLRHLL